MFVTIINKPITEASVPFGAVVVIIESDGAVIPSQKNSSTALKTHSIAKLLKKKNIKK